MSVTLARFRNLVLVLALGLLLATEVELVPPDWRGGLFVSHLGAFLLWQPLVPGSRRLSMRDLLVVIGAGVAAIHIED